MKVFLTSDQMTARTRRQFRKLEAVKYLLEKKEACVNLNKLAGYLLQPGSDLMTLPAPLLVELIESILHFLTNQADDVSIQTSSLSRYDQLLLIDCPDIPHAIDSLLALQNRFPHPFQLLAHQTLMIQRNSGEIAEINSQAVSGRGEILIILRMETMDSRHVSELSESVLRVMQATVACDQSRNFLLSQLEAAGHISPDENIRQFTTWLAESAFTPLSHVSLTLPRNSQPDFSGLTTVINRTCYADSPNLEAELGEILGRPADIIVQPLSCHSLIIRDVPLVYIGFRKQQGDSQNIELAFIGLFDEKALYGPACQVPYLRRIVYQALDSFKLRHDSYDFRQLVEIFNLFPKIELFFFPETQLHLLKQSLRRYLFRPKTIKLLLLSSINPGRVTLLAILPATLAGENMVESIKQTLSKALSGHLESSRFIYPGGHFSGLQLSVVPERDEFTLNVDRLERLLNRVTRPWTTRLRLLLERALSKPECLKLWARYQQAFPADYQALLAPRFAVQDLLKMERLIITGKQQINLLVPGDKRNTYRLHFYSEQEYYLDFYIPVLENLNLQLIDQVQFNLPVAERTVYIKSFLIRICGDQCRTLQELRPQLLETLTAILDGKAENDLLNGLIVLTGLSWKEVDVLRAYRNYYLQLGYSASISSIHQALLNNPEVSANLFRYFEARFRPCKDWTDPLQREEEALFPLRMTLLQHMETVSDINADKILRTFFNLIDATVRSNFHVRLDLGDYFFAFKINSLGIIDMPAPRPEYEIYVHACNMEGIHLRGGKISRGGIRWSDRPDDFRMEILGLMQTQMSKNALIIPSGAKGGFIVKSVSSLDNNYEAGKQAYITLMRGLLDLTDNYRNNKIVRLPGIVTYDGDDPYLVVAADKGTARFPDIANATATEYLFWLKDAFASGGSGGYNHKALGITARGAWVNVKRHFREMGRDIQSENFTVVGIGSMDGDVFGNGMLLSPYIQLLAAVSGQHLFLDPSPDPEKSFAERKRLFDMPASSWDDYDRALISEGGGVFSRAEKNIPLSVEIRKWLGIRYRTLDGETLIRYLLAASVDLLWLGGIGTYIKASDEQHSDAGDRSNDTVRIDATELQAKVVGEGANLGFTQKARIEYSINGGRINTDAVDNSAGVDISDHEVNLKILLYALQKDKKLADPQKAFFQVTDEICRQVLHNNYLQGLCLSLEQRRCKNKPEVYLKQAERLESASLLDRKVESFPDSKTVHTRPDKMFTRPELAVLMAGCKILLQQQLKEQPDFLTRTFCLPYLDSYFPQAISREYHAELDGHPLASDIIATLISNQIINQAGCTLLSLAPEIDPEQIMRLTSSYLTFDAIIDGTALRQAVFALDNRVEAECQYEILLLIEKILALFCRQTLFNEQTLEPDSATVGDYKQYLEAFAAALPDNGPEPGLSTAQTVRFEQAGVPGALVNQISFLGQLEDFLLLVGIANATRLDFGQTWTQFQDALNCLDLNPVFEQISRYPAKDAWEHKVVDQLTGNMKALAASLVIKSLASGSDNCSVYLNGIDRKFRLASYRNCLQGLSSAAPATLFPYVALDRELENLLT